MCTCVSVTCQDDERELLFLLFSKFYAFAWRYMKGIIKMYIIREMICVNEELVPWRDGSSL